MSEGRGSLGYKISSLMTCFNCSYRYPPGHGDIYAAITDSGILDKLVAEVGIPGNGFALPAQFSMPVTAVCSSR
jgi:hypothetical protein